MIQVIPIEDREKQKTTRVRQRSVIMEVGTAVHLRDLTMPGNAEGKDGSHSARNTAGF